MLKVLHLTPSFPYPADTGGKIGIWNLLRADARSVEVGLLSFVDGAPDDEAAGVVRSVCRQVSTLPRPRTLDGIAGGARSLVSNVAMNLAKYRWPGFSDALHQMVGSFQPDVVVAHHLHMGGYLLGLSGPALVLREHNIDSDLMERYAATLGNPVLAGLARHQAQKIRETERELTRRVDCCMMITPPDEARLREIAPHARTAIVPGVIATEEYKPALEAEPGDALLVVATGTFTFPPTGEGLVYFLETVWPRVIASAPRARFRVIGHCPEAIRRRAAALPGVEILGRVKSVEAHLDGAHAFAVPVRAGSGMRMRILEALAWQIPVVTTTTGCEGIAVENERHLLIADQPGEMATAILRVAREAPLARSLRSEGRRLVEEGYSLEAAGKLMQQVYRRCCEDRAPGTERGRPAAAPSPGQPAS